jgi:hypothetical protein
MEARPVIEFIMPNTENIIEAVIIFNRVKYTFHLYIDAFCVKYPFMQSNLDVLMKWIKAIIDNDKYAISAESITYRTTFTIMGSSCPIDLEFMRNAAPVDDTKLDVRIGIEALTLRLVAAEKRITELTADITKMRMENKDLAVQSRLIHNMGHHLPVFDPLLIFEPGEIKKSTFLDLIGMQPDTMLFICNGNADRMLWIRCFEHCLVPIITREIMRYCLGHKVFMLGTTTVDGQYNTFYRWPPFFNKIIDIPTCELEARAHYMDMKYDEKVSTSAIWRDFVNEYTHEYGAQTLPSINAICQFLLNQVLGIVPEPGCKLVDFRRLYMNLPYGRFDQPIIYSAESYFHLITQSDSNEIFYRYYIRDYVI